MFDEQGDRIPKPATFAPTLDLDHFGLSETR